MLCSFFCWLCFLRVHNLRFALTKAASLNSFSSEEIFLGLLFTAVGIFLIIDGGDCFSGLCRVDRVLWASPMSCVVLHPSNKKQGSLAH